MKAANCQRIDIRAKKNHINVTSADVPHLHVVGTPRNTEEPGYSGFTQFAWFSRVVILKPFKT